MTDNKSINVETWAQEIREHLGKFINMVKNNTEEYPPEMLPGEWDESFLTWTEYDEDRN